MYWCWDQLVEAHGRQSLSLKRQVWYEKCFHLNSNICTHAIYRAHEASRKKNQRRIKQELKFKPCSFQTRHTKTKITLQSQHLRSGSHNTNTEAHWIPTSISHTEIKTMPKPLTIIKGSLYEQAEASCNKSLGSSRKWKNNMRKGEKKRKKRLVIAPEM